MIAAPDPPDWKPNEMMRLPLAILILAAALAGLFLSACGEGRQVAYDDLGYEKNKFTLDGALFSGIAIHKYEDGTIKAEYHIRDGVYHGVARRILRGWHAQRETGYRDASCARRQYLLEQRRLRQ
ncbi:MAG: hypothetical protein R3F11_20945 [Verrucomicrobiales bacterium]